MSGHTQNVNVCNFPDKELNTYCYKAIANGTGYSIGDHVEFKQIFHVNDPLNPTFMIWMNVSTLTPIYIQDLINTSNNSGTFPPIADFVSCNNSEQLFEKEVCATIDGVQYQINRIYTRNPITGDFVVLKYEYNNGEEVTSTVTEECCGCDSVCDAPLQLLEDVNFRCQSYGQIGGGSFTSKLLNIDWGNDTYHYYGIISPPAGTVPVTINGSSGVIWSGNINVASSISNLISGLNANDPNVNYANGTYWKTDENGGIRNRTTHTTLVVNGVTYNPTATSGNNWPCTNHFPVECYTEIAVSTNAGGSWTTVKPKGLGFTLNSVGDVIIRDDGYGLGFANLIDHVNPYIIPYGVQVKTSINNSWMTEWSSTVNHSDVKYKVLYYFIPVADADCTPDPVDYENYFTAINIMASDGDVNLMAPATNANFTGINLNTISVPNNNSYCESF